MKELLEDLWTMSLQGWKVFLENWAISGAKILAFHKLFAENIVYRKLKLLFTVIDAYFSMSNYFRMRDMYKRIDQKYIKPCLLRENHFRDPKIIETYENLTNKDAIDFMKKNPGKFNGLNSAIHEVAEAPANTSMLIALQNTGNIFPE